jgi:ketopantoate reductase
MNVLVVGAGAVGQVYGRHARLGGADVTFFVRDKYRDEVARGFELYPLNRKRGTAVRFDDFAVVTRADEVAARHFDQVYFAVSSPALQGPWLAELVAAIGDATILTLQPGEGDRDRFIAAGANAERVVSGMITLISYSAPLPGETRFPRPGMAYWFPPLAPCPISGARERVDAVIALLRKGGLPVRRHNDARRLAVFPTAVMMSYLVALECAGWSFQELVHTRLALGARASREALAVVAQSAGKPPLAIRLVMRPRILRIGLWLAQRVVPLPLEIYLKEHFTKVGAQTRAFIASYIERGHAAKLDTSALEELVAELPAQARLSA